MRGETHDLAAAADEQQPPRYGQGGLEQSLDEAKTTMLAVLDDLKKNPPTEEEVTRARTRLLKYFELSLKQSDRIGLRLSRPVLRLSLQVT